MEKNKYYEYPEFSTEDYDVKFFRELPEDYFDLKKTKFEKINKHVQYSLQKINKIYKYKVVQCFEYSILNKFKKLRHGVIIKAKINNKPIEFWSVATKNTNYSHTYIYYDWKKSIRRHILLSSPVYKKHEDQFKKWKNFLNKEE